MLSNNKNSNFIIKTNIYIYIKQFSSISHGIAASVTDTATTLMSPYNKCGTYNLYAIYIYDLSPYMYRLSPYSSVHFIFMYLLQAHAYRYTAAAT